MKIVFFGTPSFVIPILDTLHQHFEIVGVVTAPDQKVGRKQILTPSPVKQYCMNTSLEIPILTPQQWNNETIEQLKNMHAHLFVVAAYGKIIPQNILDLPKHGAINIHPSLLPKYRGPSPIQTSIRDGVTESGVTLIQMDAEMDHGPILATAPFQIGKDDTFETVATKSFLEAAKILPDTLKKLSNHAITPVEQDHSQATFCQHITKEDGYFEWENPPSREELNRIIRAYFPWPTAWTKIHMTNGTWNIVKFLPGKMMQVEGKKVMMLKDFVNGYPQLREKIISLLNG